MGQVHHGSATTTAAIRRAIQHSQASLRALAKRYRINPKTGAKWKKRTSTADLRSGPQEPKSTGLSIEEEAVILTFRRHTLLPLDDCLYALAADTPAPDTLFAAPLPSAPRHLATARHRRRQATALQVQALPDRLLPHRHRRSPNRRRQALPSRGHRQDIQVRLRQTA